jgi:thymidylate kinase
MRTILCIDGPDGSGKTYWAEHSGPKYRYIHMIPFSRRWSVRETFIGGLFAEFVMGMERCWNSSKARRSKDNVIMDRCFLAGAVYARFWDEKFKTKWYGRICGWWNSVIFKPKEILLFVPKKELARPRKAYTSDDVGLLSMLYDKEIRKFGYRMVKQRVYNFGVVQTWRI